MIIYFFFKNFIYWMNHVFLNETQYYYQNYYQIIINNFDLLIQLSNSSRFSSATHSSRHSKTDRNSTHQK